MDKNTIDDFISCLKRINHKSNVIHLPNKGEYIKLESVSANFYFIIDINLRGRVGNTTLQLRNKSYIDKPILRLDISGPSHPNPEGAYDGAGKVIDCPHLHIAHPLYGDAIAYPLDHDMVKIHLTNDQLNDLVVVLKCFLEYINTGNIFDFIYQEQTSLP